MWLGAIRCGAVSVSTTESGRGGRLSRDWPHLSLSTPLLGYKAVLKGANEFELHTLSVDWSTESTLPCDQGDNNKQTEYPRVISGQRRKLRLLGPGPKLAVLLGRPTLLLFV